MKTFTLANLFEMLYHYEKRVGRRPVSVSLTQNQYNDLRLDPELRFHIELGPDEAPVSVAGVRIDIDNRGVAS